MSSSQHFETLKFEALDHFLQTVQAGGSAPSLDEERLEDLTLDFLERCDVVLEKTLKSFLSLRRLKAVGDEDFRAPLVAQVDQIQFSLQEPRAFSDLMESCMELLEALEDVSSTWLALVLLGRPRLRRLYAELEQFAEREAKGCMGDDLRLCFIDLVDHSRLLNGEEKVRFRMRIEHDSPEFIVVLLERFLQAHLEYAEVLQPSFLKKYPEVCTVVHDNLMKAAEDYEQ